MSAFGAVWDHATELRDAMDAAFAVRETEGGPANLSDWYVNEGPPADDCPQAVVYLQSLRTGTVDGLGLGLLDAQTWTLLVATYAVRVVRCAAESVRGARPAITALEASAQAQMSDGHVMMQSVMQGVADGSLFGSCVQVGGLSVIGVETQGGVVGNLLTVSVGL